MTLNELKVGEYAEITGYALGNAAYRAKLLALGLTHGVVVRIVHVAPLGDPVELAVRGYHLSLRKDEAKVIKIAPLSVEDVRRRAVRA